MHFIYDYFIIQLKCFNAFNCFFISQLDPGAQKDQIPERWPAGLHWNSQRKGSSSAFSCIVTFTSLPSIALSVHCLSWSAIFSLSLFLSPTLVQDYIALLEYSAQSNSLCTTLKCTVGPSVSLSLSGERQNRGARPSGGPVSLPFTFNWGQNTVNSVKSSLQKQSL